MNTHSSLAHFILYWIVAAVAILLTSRVVRGFQVDGFFAGLLAAAGVGVANYLLWPLLIFLTLPINLLTLGLFTFVVNGAILKIAAAFLPGFRIEGWLSAIFGSIVLSVLSALLHYVLV